MGRGRSKRKSPVLEGGRALGYPNRCQNHPDRKALSQCHGCGDWFCHDCLLEGPEYYYCEKSSCRSALLKEKKPDIKLKTVVCPSCRETVEGDTRFCPECGYRLKPVAEDEEDDLVTIACFGTALEAHLARTKLESQGIESYVADENMISLCPTYDVGLGGVKLKTKKSETGLALKILNDAEKGSVWAMHPIAAAVYAAPGIAGIPLLVALTPFAVLLHFIWKATLWRLIHRIFYT